MLQNNIDADQPTLEGYEQSIRYEGTNMQKLKGGMWRSPI